MGPRKARSLAMFLAREMELRYATTWLIGHEFCLASRDRPEPALARLIEVDESYRGGRDKTESRARRFSRARRAVGVRSS